ncbi:MAG: cell division protein ZipA C-terminal FtsZ-binding domain-containing protein [Gallionellaceae bacterium]|nr:cell division protein ZipA C-terminal FtsZ-binding domain-containing protein [Gallionellaceae bacterium]
MSELQTSLLIIGIAVVIAVYGYSWWQQRQYRRRFGAAFQPHREDVLYQRPVAERPVDELLAEPTVDAVDALDRDTGQALPAVSLSGEPLRMQVAEGVCALLDAATDYIAILSLNGPGDAQALAPLWQQRFDFGKNVRACGLNAASGAWEKVVAESTLSYSAFKLALQLADRSGAVSETRLMDFRDLARDIAAQMHAEAELPDVAIARARALELDGFCAEVDQMIGLNILPSGERKFSGNEIAGMAELHGMELQADGAFHLLDANGHTLFSLGNYDNVPFQHHTLGQMWSGGLTLLLDVPRVEQPAQRFDGMAVLARQLAMGLRAALVDDHRVALGESGIAQIREQVAAIESRMLSGNIAPGSAQARRLFA